MLCFFFVCIRKALLHLIFVLSFLELDFMAERTFHTFISGFFSSFFSQMFPIFVMFCSFLCECVPIYGAAVVPAKIN